SSPFREGKETVFSPRLPVLFHRRRQGPLLRGNAHPEQYQQIQKRRHRRRPKSPQEEGKREDLGNDGEIIGMADKPVRAAEDRFLTGDHPDPRGPVGGQGTNRPIAENLGEEEKERRKRPPDRRRRPRKDFAGHAQKPEQVHRDDEDVVPSSHLITALRPRPPGVPPGHAQFRQPLQSHNQKQRPPEPHRLTSLPPSAVTRKRRRRRIRRRGPPGFRNRRPRPGVIRRLHPAFRRPFLPPPDKHQFQAESGAEGGDQSVGSPFGPLPHFPLQHKQHRRRRHVSVGAQDGTGAGQDGLLQGKGLLVGGQHLGSPGMGDIPPHPLGGQIPPAQKPLHHRPHFPAHDGRNILGKYHFQTVVHHFPSHHVQGPGPSHAHRVDDPRPVPAHARL